MSPRSLGGRTLVARADVPEAGTWYRTDDVVEHGVVWARVPREDEGHEDEDALRLAWERLGHLEHPAAPRGVAYDDRDEVLFVAAPEGVPMRYLLDHRQEPAFAMTPGTVLDVGVQLADLLVHAHERGRPHGHLSPDTIWVTSAGRLVVWGLAVGPDHVGSPRWWAPERARGRRASGDADQWALAAILAALVTGRMPWRGEDPVTEARVGDASHLSSPVMEQWKPLGRLVERALSAEPRDRFPSMHPMRQALIAMAQRVGQPSDLARMGEALAAIHAPVDPALDDDAHDVDPEDAPPAPKLLMPAPSAGEADDGGAVEVDTDVDEVEPGTLPAPLEVAAFDLEEPTDHLTSPTRVPDGAFTDAGTRATAVPSDDLDEDAGSTPTGPSIAVAERTTPADLVPYELWERVDMRGVAPWLVGGMGLLLVVALVRALW